MEKQLDLSNMPVIDSTIALSILNKLKSLVTDRVDLDFNYTSAYPNSSLLFNIEFHYFNVNENPTVTFILNDDKNIIGYKQEYLFGVSESPIDVSGFVKDFDEFLVCAIAYAKHTLATSLIVTP